MTRVALGWGHWNFQEGKWVEKEVGTGCAKAAPILILLWTTGSHPFLISNLEQISSNIVIYILFGSVRHIVGTLKRKKKP